MTQITEQLLYQALQLSPHEREELAEQLYLSLHECTEPQKEVDAACSEEVHHRIAKVLKSEYPRTQINGTWKQFYGSN